MTVGSALLASASISPISGCATLASGGITLMLGVLVGACFGSFAYATALRLNRREDFIGTASACRHCGKTLHWHQNLPLIGWLVSLGRCRFCGEKIPLAYLFAEIVMAVIGGILAVSYPPVTAVMLGLASTLMLICGLTDYEKMLLHLPVIWALGGLGLGLSLTPFWHIAPMEAVLGMVAPVVAITAINAAYRWWRGVSGFGSGDAWLLAAAGCWLGPIAALGLFFMAGFIGAGIGLMLMLCRRSTRHDALPFGVFIAAVFIFMPILGML